MRERDKVCESTLNIIKHNTNAKMFKTEIKVCQECQENSSQNQFHFVTSQRDSTWGKVLWQVLSSLAVQIWSNNLMKLFNMHLDRKPSSFICTFKKLSSYKSKLCSFENSCFEKTWFRQQKYQHFLFTKIVLIPQAVYVMQNIRFNS